MVNQNKDDKAGGSPDDETTRLILRKPKRPSEEKSDLGGSVDDMAPTESAGPGVGSDEPATRLIKPTKQTAEENDTTVVGWVVIVKGPGKGRSVELGFGANTIGRNPDQQVCLNFGDENISRSRHATIVFDPKGLRFYLQPGESRNLTYLKGVPVLAPAELFGGEDIELGETTLRFVPFCSQDFSW